MLIWFHSSSSSGHFNSRVPIALLYQQNTATTTKEEPAYGGRWPECLAQGGGSDPTLWEPLSPLTGEPQDLLDITGLRGGLPKTNRSLFKSAWKSHKKLVSSHLHYPAFRRSFPVLFFPCTHSMPNSQITAEREGSFLQTALPYGPPQFSLRRHRLLLQYRTHRHSRERLRGKLAQRKCLTAIQMAKNTYEKFCIFNRLLNYWVQASLRSDLFSLCLFEQMQGKVEGNSA